jgi:hypothetical protein
MTSTSIDTATLLRHRMMFGAPVKQPLVLISQIQRSGGTLISQLLDGHSQLHVHPGELHVGRPRKYNWPALDVTRPPAELFDQLFERPILEYAQAGYQKLSHAEAAFDPDYRSRVLPFVFDVPFQKALFVELASREPIRRQRDALDHYVTSYFTAWLDYQGLYRPPSQIRYWACFGARILSQPGNLDRFAADYPDGKAIAVLRHPVSWFASARRHSNEYDDAAAAAALWTESFGTIRDNLARRPDTTLLVTLEECATDARAVMRRIAGFLGIAFEPSLLTPTFNGMPISSDSSFGGKFGVDPAVADRSATVPAPLRDLIDRAAGPLHAELEEIARRHARRYDLSAEGPLRG